MSFGLCPTTGLSFAQKFPASVYEALPSPSPITADVQFARAMELEASLDATQPDGWKEGSKRYLFFNLNPFPERRALVLGKYLGVFCACPADVKGCFFIESCPVEEFRWFVIDPESREEVAYIYSQMAEFWKFQENGQEDAWWYKQLLSHKHALED